MDIHELLKMFENFLEEIATGQRNQGCTFLGKVPARQRAQI
jgi:hypothetical protein